MEEKLKTATLVDNQTTQFGLAVKMYLINLKQRFPLLKLFKMYLKVICRKCIDVI